MNFLFHGWIINIFLKQYLTIIFFPNFFIFQLFDKFFIFWCEIKQLYSEQDKNVTSWASKFSIQLSVSSTHACKDDTPLAICANVWATLYMTELDRPKLLKMGHGTSYNIDNKRRRISETKHGIRYYLRIIDKLLSLLFTIKIIVNFSNYKSYKGENPKPYD